MPNIKLTIEVPENIYHFVMNTGTYGHYRFNTAEAIRKGEVVEESDDVVSREEVCNIADDIKDYCVSMYNPNDASEAEIINYIYKYVDALYDLPSVTPKREQGEWIKGEPWSEGYGMGETYGYYYTCSKCGNLVQGDYNACDMKYCPNCGAGMR